MKAFVIGGSAGSIEALEEILPHLPPVRSFPVIVVLHLLPRGQSLLPLIFRDRCPWPVKEAESTEPIENGVVYFASNDYHLSIEKDFTFSLSNEEAVLFSRPSIDLFFRSAAAAFKNELVALLLSGANSDGSQGIQAVLNKGGLAIVQDPETAKVAEMPRAAIKASPDVTIMNSSEVVEFLNGRK